MSATRSILCGLTSVALLCLLARSAGATARHVPADYPTIQAAIDAATTDDEILVDPGTYFENLDTLSKRLRMKSTGGPDVTIIDGQSFGRVLVFSGRGLVEGFTFQHGFHAVEGGGLYCPPIVNNDTTTIRGNVFRSNTAGFGKTGDGGGLAVRGAFIFVESNRIIDNEAGGGAGIDAAGGLVFIRNNVFRGNHAGIGGGAADLSSSKFSNNLVDGNSAGVFGGGISGGGTVENNTIVNNTASLGAGIDARDGGTCRRNVVALNRGEGISGGHLECNDSWGNTGPAFVVSTTDTLGGRNFSDDPLFCDPAASDYRISAASPCAATGPSGCGLIGAFDVGCGVVPVRRETWGTVKVRYR